MTSNLSRILRHILCLALCLAAAGFGHVSGADAQQSYRLSASAPKAEEVAVAPAPAAPTAASIQMAQVNAREGRPAVIQPVPSMETIAQAKAAQSASGQNASALPPGTDGPSFYLGAGASYSNTDSGISDTTGSADLDEASYGFKVFGGFQITSMFGAEVQYINLGGASLTGNAGDTFRANGTTYAFTGNDSEISVSGWSVGAAGVLTLPVSDLFNPFAKLGLHRWKVDYELSNATGSANGTETGIDLYFGGGLQMNLTDHLSLRGEYERYLIDSDGIDVFTGSLMLRL